jgi:site-specific DNA recombinase
MTDATKKSIKLVATYARVSTARQEEEQTVKNQQISMSEYAQKNNLTIVRQYIDEGWSGTILMRPELDKLRADAKQKLWDAVLIYDPDRLARKSSYQALIMDELQDAGIEVMFVTTPAPKNDEDKILYGFKGLFAEYERAKITERFRLGKLRKANAGHIIASEAPYGYTFICKRGKMGDANFLQGHYVINEDEARVVKKIFSWIADEQLTLRKVVKRLQELGIRPRKSKRGVWNTSTLGTMLRNKTYIGEAHYGSTYAVMPERPFKKDIYRKIKKSSRKVKPEAEWTKIPTIALIGEDLFMRAQQQLKKNSEFSARNRKNKYLLAGKMRCVCGHTRAGEGPQHGKHLYYRCTGRVQDYPLPAKCTERGINARIADVLVWKKVSQLMSSKALMLKQAKRWADSRQTKIAGPTLDATAVQKEIAQLKEQRVRYMKAYGVGVYSVAELEEYLMPIKTKIASLESELAQATAALSKLKEAPMPTNRQVETFAAKSARALLDLNFEAKRAIVMNIVDRVIGTQKELQVYGFIPVTNYVEYKTSDRHSWAPQRGEVHPL